MPRIVAEEPAIQIQSVAISFNFTFMTLLTSLLFYLFSLSVLVQALLSQGLLDLQVKESHSNQA